MNNTHIWSYELASRFRSLLGAGFEFYSYLLSVYFLVIDYVASPFLAEEEEFLINIHRGLEEEKIRGEELFDECAAYVFTVIETVQGSAIVILGWFAAFLLVFSHSVQPTASNEYLLFGCFLFTLFMVYGQLSTGLDNTFAPAVSAIQNDASLRVNWAATVNNFHTDTVEGHHVDMDAAEQLSAVSSLEVDEPTEADDIVIEQALVAVATQSLHSAVSEELSEELMEEVVEELDTGEAAVDELLEEAEEESLNG
jgi:hypothetical protein